MDYLMKCSFMIMRVVLSILIRELVHLLTICTQIVFRIGYSMISDAEKKGLISPGKVIH